MELAFHWAWQHRYIPSSTCLRLVSFSLFHDNPVEVGAGEQAIQLSDQAAAPQERRGIGIELRPWRRCRIIRRSSLQNASGANGVSIGMAEGCQGGIFGAAGIAVLAQGLEASAQRLQAGHPINISRTAHKIELGGSAHSRQRTSFIDRHGIR